MFAPKPLQRHCSEACRRAADKDDISYSDFAARLARAQFQAKQEGALERRIRRANPPQRWSRDTFPFARQPGVKEAPWGGQCCPQPAFSPLDPLSSGSAAWIGCPTSGTCYSRNNTIAGVPTGVYWPVKLKAPVCRFTRKQATASLR